MCGILGLVGTRWRDHAATALATLRSRGPDEQTLTTVGEAVFAHTRLAVIDLCRRPSADADEDGRYTIVFNGEIYNAGELRRDSKPPVRNSSPTTRYRGAAARLSRLGPLAASTGSMACSPSPYGMPPAPAVCRARQTRHQALHVCRHRRRPRLRLDAGTLFALPRFKEARRRGAARLPGLPDAAGAADLPARRTSAAAGALLRLRCRENTLQAGRWWSIPVRRRPRTITKPCSPASMQRCASVRRQLTADAPLGAFLSGGIDPA